MQTRDEKQRQKRLCVRRLVRAGVQPRVISDQLGISITYVRAAIHDLHHEEALVAQTLHEGQNTRHGPAVK
ncbi:MAG: hypothetical protein PVSMB7_24260 [Chloroflexota bacterium]